MTTKRDLLNAILAMDSYNRGYDPGIVDPGYSLGDATILQTIVDGQVKNFDSELLVDENDNRRDTNIGFYAIAY